MKNLTYKEINMQPQSFAAINETLPALFSTLDKAFPTPDCYEEIIFTGCGTSFYLAQSAAYLYSALVGRPAKAVPCSELYFTPEVYTGGRKTLVLPITRKSYTTEVRMAIDKVRSVGGVQSLAITCDPDSAAYNDFVLLSPDTAEDSVIMTRSYTSMLYLAVILSLYVGGKKGDIEAMTADYPLQAERFIREADAFSKKLIEEHHHLNLYITLGQGVNYGVANECMNKMKEMGLTNSEGYYSLEYRHGPMSLVDENTLILLLANTASNEYDAALLRDMKKLGATTAVVGALPTEQFDADYRLDMDTTLTSEQRAPIIAVVGQLLGCYIAVHKGLDYDSPRHLSQAIVLK